MNKCALTPRTVPRIEELHGVAALQTDLMADKEARQLDLWKRVAETDCNRTNNFRDETIVAICN